MNTRQIKRDRRRLILGGLSVLLLIAGLMLLQYRSVNSIAISQQREKEEALRREINHVLFQSLFELRSLLFMTADEDDNPDLQGIADNIALWEGESSQDISRPEVLIYKRDSGEWLRLNQQGEWTDYSPSIEMQDKNRLDLPQIFPKKLILPRDLQKGPEHLILLLLVDYKDFYGGVLHQGLSTTYRDYRFQIRGSEGSLYFDNTEGLEQVYFTHQTPPLIQPERLLDWRGNSNGEERKKNTGDVEILLYRANGKTLEEESKQWKRQQLSLPAAFGLLLLAGYLLLFYLFQRRRALQMKEQEFVASVSHELKTPIAVIKSAADNLSSGILKDKDRIRQYGHRIELEAERLGRMVSNILRYSSLEQQTAPLKDESFSPRLLMNESIERLRHLESVESLKLICAPSIPESIFCNRQTLGTIIENLIVNGLTHNDGAPLKVSMDSIIPPALRIIVQDEGPGIPKKEQNLIFQAFGRGSLSREKQISGSGLGLHLASKLTEQLGGSLTLESPWELPDGTLQRGCRFTLLIPLGKRGNNISAGEQYES